MYEGEAKIIGKSIVLYCRKELQKCMRVEWTQDGKPPSARVISEQICDISAVRLIVTSSRNGSLLTLRKENMFAAKLWRSSSSGGVEERKNKSIASTVRIETAMGFGDDSFHNKANLNKRCPRSL